MKVLIICDHYPISPRVEKIRRSLLGIYPEADVKIFAWNRENRDVNEDYVETYSQDLVYGNKFQKAVNLIKFINSVKKYTKLFCPDYIHVIDIEMLITGIIVKKTCKIIYEIYDIKFLVPSPLNNLRANIEKILINRYVDAIITASPFFINYYKEKLGVRDIKHITLNNKPSSKTIYEKNNADVLKLSNFKKDDIVIGFIGTVRYEEILQNLITSAKLVRGVKILIAGSGPSLDFIKQRVLDEKLEEMVSFTGRYYAQDLKKLYSSCDYIWAAYPNKDENVKYAISNKYFESQLFKKKVIVSEGTFLGDFLEKGATAYTINPYDTSSIVNLLESLEKLYNFKVTSSIGIGNYWEDEELELKKIYN